MSRDPNALPVLVAGGGIGGLAAALALTRRGFKVEVLEQAPQLGEIGAGIQLGPNAFAAFDALGVGPQARARAVYTDEMVMHDAIDETLVGRIPTGEAFRRRFGNPYAVIHRADVHTSLLEGARASDRIRVHTGTTVQRFEQDDAGVTVHDSHGDTHRGIALIGADGVKSAVRRLLVGDEARVSGQWCTAPSSTRRTFRPTCNGTRPASGSARTATWCTTRCAAASSTTSSSPSTAASRKSGACA